MTGLDRQNMTLMLYKKGEIKEAIIFIERYDEIKAKWVGSVMLPNEVMEISGIKNTAYLDEFNENFASYMFNKRIENIYMDFENRDFNYVGDALSLVIKSNLIIHILIL